MRNKKTVSFVSVVTAVLIILCSMSIFTVISAGECSLTVHITNPSGKSVSDISVCLVEVAYSDLSGRYTLSDGFVGSDIDPNALSLDLSAENADAIYEYLIQNSVSYTQNFTDANGRNVFSNLDEGIYLVFGVDGESVSFEPYIVILPEKSDDDTVYNVVSEPKTAFVDTPSGKNISVTKIWNDNMDTAGVRPTSIGVALYLNGEAYLKTDLSSDNGWKAEFTEHPESGEYTISESVGSSAYLSTISESTSGFVITNTLDTSVVTPVPSSEPDDEEYYLSVQKIWGDNDDVAEKRPTYITVQLIRDNEVSATAVLNENNDWSTIFTELDKNSKYTIKEITPTEYSVVYDGSMSAGYRITNTYTENETDPGVIPTPAVPEESERASITVSKIWDDDENSSGARPESVTIYLLTGGSVYRTAVLNAENGWTYTFTELPANITYTFSEGAVSDYTAVYSGSATLGFTVTNSYTPGTSVVDEPLDPSEPEPEPTAEPTAKPTSRSGNGGGSSGFSTSTATPAPSATSSTDTNTDTSTETDETPISSDTPSDSDTPNENTTTSDDTMPSDAPSDSSPNDNSSSDNSSGDNLWGNTPQDESSGETSSSVETDAPNETEDDETVTIIPQTGVNFIPIYVLSALGVLFILAGIIEIIIGSGRNE